MVLELRDYEYFGYFNMDILRSMRELRRLELRVENGELTRWDREDFMAVLTRDFREEGEVHPEWDMPLIQIVSKHTGEAVTLGKYRAHIGRLGD